MDVMVARCAELESLVGESQITQREAQRLPVRKILEIALSEEINSLSGLGTFGAAVGKSDLPTDAIVLPLSVTCRVMVTKDPIEFKAKLRVIVRREKKKTENIGEMFSPIGRRFTVELLFPSGFNFNYMLRIPISR